MRIQGTAVRDSSPFSALRLLSGKARSSPLYYRNQNLSTTWGPQSS